MIPRIQGILRGIKSRFQAAPRNLPDFEAVLSLYGLKLTSTPTAAPGGMRNKNVIIETDQGKKLLKCYKSSLGDSTIVQEHSILQYLQQQAFPAVRITPSKSEKTLVSIGQDRYVIFDFIEGGFRLFDYMLPRNQVNRFIVMAGSILADLHNCLKDFIPNGYNPDGLHKKSRHRIRGPEWFLEKLTTTQKRVSARHKTLKSPHEREFQRQASYVGDLIYGVGDRLSRVELPCQIIHKDYNRSNLLFRKNRSPVIIDFEMARLDWKVIDIISGWEGFCYHKKGINLDKARLFLRSYLRKNTLTKDEMDLIPTVWQFLDLRRFVLSWHRYNQNQIAAYLEKSAFYLNRIRHYETFELEIRKLLD